MFLMRQVPLYTTGVTLRAGRVSWRSFDFPFPGSLTSSFAGDGKVVRGLRLGGGDVHARRVEVPGERGLAAARALGHAPNPQPSTLNPQPPTLNPEP